MPFNWWSYEDPEEQRKRHAADFADIASGIKQQVQQSQVQEHIGGLLEQARNALPSYEDVRSTTRAATSWMDPVLQPVAEFSGVNDRDKRLTEMQGILDRSKPSMPEPTSPRELIDGTRSILSGDPRHEPACEPPEQAFSCQLEQTLASIGGRLDGLDRILSRTLRSVQL